ncbi:MAG: dTDP-4-dehydrorhamnose 3,5-epimerase family protein [Acidobacteria bacterium]|nr:dTDP-4-dehydrorhamnose 3,5-epimerase family protein [Acidobacteriota bacterium]
MAGSDIAENQPSFSPLLPVGVEVRSLSMHPDDRGVFTEIFRKEWNTRVVPIQWNMVRSEKGVLRGVHVHIRHDDYLVVASGRATVGLRDLRRGSLTEAMALRIDLDGSRLQAVTIPRGVAHGFYFHEPSIHIYAVSRYWDVEDELCCHWADPHLKIPWEIKEVRLSERDQQAPPLRELLKQLEPWQPIKTPNR